MPAEKLAVPRQQTGNPVLDSVQKLAQQLTQRANLLPFFTGTLVKGITFAAGVDKLVAHGLGRRPQGVMVLRDYGANVCTGVGESTTQPTDIDQRTNLRSPVACTVDLWVF